MAKILIDPIAVLDGSLPKRAMELVLEWAAAHQDELRAAFNAVTELRRPEKIAPLE